MGSGSGRSMRWIRLNLAEIEFDLGDWEAADEQVKPLATPYRGVALAHARLREAQLALGRGQHGDARRELDQADDLLANALEPQYIALLAALRAELERRGGELDGRRARSTAASTGSSSAATTPRAWRWWPRPAPRSPPTPPSGRATSATSRRSRRRWPGRSRCSS